MVKQQRLAKLKKVARQYNRHPKGSGQGGQFAPKSASPYQSSNKPGDLSKDAFLNDRDYNKQIRASYFDEAGVQTGSSRNTPTQVPDIPVGAWKMDDWDSLYGRMIEQLVEFSPDDLKNIALSENMVATNEEGRGDDAERYAGWMAEGKQAPAITLLEMEDGGLRVSDGHRRVAAAVRAGKPLLAWVSFVVPNGKTDYAGKPMKTALTWELAKEQGFDADKALKDAKAQVRRSAK